MRLTTFVSLLAVSITGSSAEAVAANNGTAVDKVPTVTINPDPTEVMKLDSTVTMEAGSCPWCCGSGSGLCNWNSGCASMDCACGNLKSLCGCIIQLKLSIIKGILGKCPQMLGSITSGISETFDSLLNNKIFSQYEISDLFTDKRSNMIDDFSNLVSNATRLVLDTADLSHTAHKQTDLHDAHNSRRNVQKLVVSSQLFADKVIGLIEPFSSLNAELNRRLFFSLDQLKVERAGLNKFLSIPAGNSTSLD